MIYPLTSATFLNTYSLIPNLPEILDNFKKSLPIGGKVHSEVTFYSANKKKFIKDLLYRVEYSNKNGKFGITFAICFCKKSYYPFSKIYTSVLTNNVEVFEGCQCFYFNQKLDTINFKEIVDQLIQPSYNNINKEYTEDKIMEIFAKGESLSNHPIAKSVLKKYNKEVSHNDIKDFKEV